MSALLSLLGTGALGISSNSGSSTTNQLQNFLSQLSSISSGTQQYSQNLTPYQQSLQAPLFNTVSTAMSNPSAITAPAENTAINQVNDNYSGLSQSLRQQFLQTGGGQSGKYGLALASANQNRLSNISGVQNQFAQTNATLPLSVASLAGNLLGMNFGGTTSSTGSSASSSSGSSSGSSSTNSSSTGIKI